MSRTCSSGCCLATRPQRRRRAAALWTQLTATELALTAAAATSHTQQLRQPVAARQTMTHRQSSSARISHELMAEPVLCDGHTYERTCIEAWLARSRTSPMTGEPLSADAALLMPNRALRSAIAAFARQQRHR